MCLKVLTSVGFMDQGTQTPQLESDVVWLSNTAPCWQSLRPTADGDAQLHSSPLR